MTFREWLPIIEYEELYEISNNGEVYSVKGCKKLKPALSSNGYYRVNLHRNGKPKTRYVHQLVCEAFNGLRPVDKEVSHKDNNKLNNQAYNLCWATRKENALNSPFSQERRNKLRSYRRGVPLPQEVKNKISGSLMGHIVPQEVRDKIAKGNKKPKNNLPKEGV